MRTHLRRLVRPVQTVVAVVAQKVDRNAPPIGALELVHQALAAVLLVLVLGTLRRPVAPCAQRQADARVREALELVRAAARRLAAAGLVGRVAALVHPVAPQVRVDAEAAVAAEVVGGAARVAAVGGLVGRVRTVGLAVAAQGSGYAGARVASELFG